MVYGLPLQAAFANPAGGNVVAGSAAINSVGSTTTITQGSDRAIINWQSFSVGQGELTQFIQPGAQSAILNRVTGGDPSAILGALQSNGQVYLINPNGIVFGPNANIDVGGIIASTLNIANDQFMRGGDLSFTGSSQAGVYNYGSIRALEGDIYLIGSNVANHGVLQASQGAVGLLAGQSVTLVDGARPHLPVTANSRSISSSGVTNSGLINAVRVELAANGGNVYALAINNTGTIRATGSVERGGRIYLTAPGGKIANSGDLLAKSGPNGGQINIDAGAGGSVELSGNIDASGATGGTVHVLGDQVALASAKINASGSAGDGGTVLVGGDYQGAGSVHNAIDTSVDVDSSINVDAGAVGNGGRVIVWADDHTEFYGSVTGRGGASSGDGGFAEVSGKNTLDFNGYADLSAAAGDAGLLLLDPTDFEVNAGNFMSIQNILANNNLLITTIGDSGDVGDITVNHDLTWFSPTLLEMRAHRHVIINNQIQAREGSFTAVAGWSPTAQVVVGPAVTGTPPPLTTTSFTPFDPSSGNFGDGGSVLVNGGGRAWSLNGNIQAYGRNVVLQGSGAGSALLGSQHGFTRVGAKRDVMLLSGASYAQIGSDRTDIAGSIDSDNRVRAGRDVILMTESDESYAQIGNGEPFEYGDFGGDILVRAGRNVELLSPFIFSFAKIGNGSPYGGGSAWGDITVEADAEDGGAGVKLFASAMESYTQIGNGGFAFYGEAYGDIEVSSLVDGSSGGDVYVHAGREDAFAQIGHWAPYSYGDIDIAAYRDVLVEATADNTTAVIGHATTVVEEVLGIENEIGNGIVLAGDILVDAGRNVIVTAGDDKAPITGGDFVKAMIGHLGVSEHATGIVLAGDIDVNAGLAGSDGFIRLLANFDREGATAQIGHLGWLQRHNHIQYEAFDYDIEVPEGVFILGRIRTHSRADTELLASGTEGTARIGHWGVYDTGEAAIDFDSYEGDAWASGDVVDVLAELGLGEMVDGLELDDLVDLIGPGVYILGGVHATAGIDGESGGNIVLDADGLASTAQIGSFGVFTGEGFLAGHYYEDDYFDLPQFTGVFIAGNVSARAHRYDGVGGDIRLYAGGTTVANQLLNTAQIGHRGLYDFTTLVLLDDLFDVYDSEGDFGFGFDDIAGVVIAGNIGARADRNIEVGAGGGASVNISGNRAQIGHRGEAFSQGFLVAFEEEGRAVIQAVVEIDENGNITFCHRNAIGQIDPPDNPYENNILTLPPNAVHVSLGGTSNAPGVHGGPNHAVVVEFNGQQYIINDVLPLEDGTCPNPFLPDGPPNQFRIPIDVPGAGVLVLGHIHARAGDNIYVSAVTGGAVGSMNAAQIGHLALASGGRYDGINLGDLFHVGHGGFDLADGLSLFGDVLGAGAFALGDITAEARNSIYVSARGVDFNQGARGSNSAQIGHEAQVYAKRTEADILRYLEHLGHDYEYENFEESNGGLSVHLGPLAVAAGDIYVYAKNGDVSVYAMDYENDAQIGHEVVVDIENGPASELYHEFLYDLYEEYDYDGGFGFNVGIGVGLAVGDISVEAGNDVKVVNSGGYNNDAQIGHEATVASTDVIQVLLDRVELENLNELEVQTNGFGGGLDVLVGLALGDIDVSAGRDVLVHSFSDSGDSQIGHEVNVAAYTEFDFGDLPRMYQRIVSQTPVVPGGPLLMFGIAKGDISVVADRNVSLQTGMSGGMMYEEAPSAFGSDAQIGHEVGVADYRIRQVGANLVELETPSFMNEIGLQSGGLGLHSLALAEGNIVVVGGENVLLNTYADVSDTQIGHEVNTGNQQLAIVTATPSFVEGPIFGQPSIKAVAKGDIKVLAITKDVIVRVHDDAFFGQAQIGHEVFGRQFATDSAAAINGLYQPFVKGEGTALGDIFVVAGRDIQLLNQGSETSEAHIGHGSGRGLTYKLLGGDIVAIAGRNFVMEGSSEFDLAFVGHDGGWSDTNHKFGRILIAWDQVDSKADNGGRFFMNRYSVIDSGQRVFTNANGEIIKVKNPGNLTMLVGTRREGAMPNVIENGALINGVAYDSSLENLGDPNGRNLTFGNQAWGENTEFESWSAEQWGFELWDIIDNPSLQQLLDSCDLDLNFATLGQTYTGPFTFYYLDREETRIPEIFDYNVLRELPYWPDGVGVGASGYGEDEREGEEITGDSSYNVFQP
jgi:filamentous hemagglutinin family protein